MMSKSIRSTNLLFLPGMMCDESLWRHQAAALDTGWRIYHGDICQHADIAGIAAHVLAEAPPSFVVAGLSMGGIVAMEMWRQAPERIEGLAFIDTNFRADSEDRKLMRERQIAEVEQGALRRILTKELKPNYLAACHRDDEILLNEVLAMGMRLGRDVFVRQSQALRDRPDSAITLASIDCPALVLCGAQDSLCPPETHREMAEMIPGSILEVIDDCGHLSTLEQPRAVSAALRAWLTQ